MAINDMNNQFCDKCNATTPHWKDSCDFCFAQDHMHVTIQHMNDDFDTMQKNIADFRNDETAGEFLDRIRNK